MESNFKTMIFSICVLFVTVSCSNDNDQNNSAFESFIEIQGEEYTLENGYFVKSNSTEFILQLTDGTISNTLDISNFSDTTTVSFSTHLNATELNGQFTLANIDSSTLVAGAECVKTASDEFNCSKTFDLSSSNSDSGAISIEKNADDTYTIIFEFSNGSNEEIRGQFKGKLSELTTPN